jgi:hypothetical protein
MFDFFALSVPRETRERQASEEAAAKLGLALSYHPVMGMAGIDDALNAIRKDNCDALLVFPDSTMYRVSDRIADFAVSAKPPSVSGRLLSQGTDCC